MATPESQATFTRDSLHFALRTMGIGMGYRLEKEWDGSTLPGARPSNRKNPGDQSIARVFSRLVHLQTGRHATALTITSCFDNSCMISPAGLGSLKKYPCASVQPSRLK